MTKDEMEAAKNLFGRYMKEGETLDQFRQRTIEDPGSFDFGSRRPRKTYHTDGTVTVDDYDDSMNWKGSTAQGYEKRFLTEDMYISSFYPDELGEEYTYVDNPNYYKAEALKKVYNILQSDQEGVDMHQDVRDVLTTIAKARWETDFYKAYDHFKEMQAKDASIDPVASAYKMHPYPLVPDDQDFQAIDPESIYHPDHDMYPGKSQAVPADAAGDPNYEKMIMDNLLEQDKGIF